MAWTYDTTLPTNKDRVRLLIGDTNIDAPLFSDEELTALITIYQGVNAAAVAAAYALAAKYSGYADKWVGDLKILASQKAKAYLELAKRLAATGVFSTGVPSAGGIRKSERDMMEEQTDRISPAFTRNSFRYEGE